MNTILQLSYKNWTGIEIKNIETETFHFLPKLETNEGKVKMLEITVPLILANLPLPKR